MSSVRVLLSAVVAFAVVAAAGVFARAAFRVETFPAALRIAAPLTAARFEPQEGPAVSGTFRRPRPSEGTRPITPDNPIPRRVCSVAPQPPAGHEDQTATRWFRSS